MDALIERTREIALAAGGEVAEGDNDGNVDHLWREGN
jgi:hypothetical protein